MNTQVTQMPAELLDRPRARSGLPASVTGFPRKILLIDENQGFCRRFRWAAQEYNSLVVYCNSLSSVSKLVEIDRFDLIIVSKEFENYRGRSLSKFVSRFFKGLPVIMLSCREDGFWDNDPMAPESVIGSIPRHFASSKILNRIGRIFQDRYQMAADPGYLPLDYTNFCQPYFNAKAPWMKSLLATCGKVLLANASLVMK
jgi:DNA-binding NtrC family response regulator